MVDTPYQISHSPAAGNARTALRGHLYADLQTAIAEAKRVRREAGDTADRGTLT